MTAAPPPDPVRVVCLRSIREVDEALWDSLNSPHDLFHTHRFVRCVEEAAVENSQFWYLLFFRGEELAATAVLSAFTVSLDLFVGGGAGRLIRGLRRWWPDFLKIKVLFCGLPVSLGQSNLVFRDRTQSASILARLAQEMAAISRAHGLAYVCLKEFLESEVEAMRPIEQHGFFLANSIPYVGLDIRWPSFESYLAELRHGYRRPIKLTLKKLGQARPVVAGPDSEARLPGRPYLRLGGPEVCSAARFFELYLQVMDRAEVKLETLNQAFFENLFAGLPADMELLAVVKDGEILGVALLMTASQTMTFVLVGLDYARRDEYDVYFNLVYGIVDLAIRRGCCRLDLGQTSYWLKQRIGGVCVPEYFYFKSNRRWLHVCLRSLRSLLFPELKVRRPRVFRPASGEPEAAFRSGLGSSLEPGALAAGGRPRG